MSSILYQIRNIEEGRKATWRTVIQAPALVLEVTTPEMIVFAAHMLVEDLRLPGHANLRTTEKFRPILPKILAGEDARWHLWEVLIYRNKMELHFADTFAQNKGAKAAALRCYLDIPEEMDIKIWTSREKTPFYHLIHLAPDETLDHLAVRYTDEDAGLEYADVYEHGPKKSEVRPMRG